LTKFRNINDKVFLDSLPRGGERRGNRINWGKSIGCIVKFIYDDIKGEVKIIKYEKDTEYLWIKYLDKEPFRIARSSFQNCCFGKMMGIVTNEFKIEIGTNYKDEKRDLIILDKEYKKGNKEWDVKWYKYRCNKCGWNEGWMKESGLINGNGCACCCPTPRITVEGINDINTTAPWMTKFFQGGYDEAKLYTKGSGNKIQPICPDCGRIKEAFTKISDIYCSHSMGCKYCGDGVSYPEKFMANVLEQVKIKFETQYIPDWIKPRKYDFYFEKDNIKYIIETDGEFHTRDNYMNGQTAKKSKEIDDYKDLKAKENGIKVIRIDCVTSALAYIRRKILDSKINNLFNLSEIDWNKCEEYALSSLVKIACDYKNKKNDIATTEIAKIMKLSVVTIRRYLKKGVKLGWCKYDPKEVQRQNGLKSGKKSSKSIEIFKEGKSLGIFESMIELEKQSIGLFGVKLSTSETSRVANGIIEQCKGYTFAYI